MVDVYEVVGVEQWAIAADENGWSLRRDPVQGGQHALRQRSIPWACMGNEARANCLKLAKISRPVYFDLPAILGGHRADRQQGMVDREGFFVTNINCQTAFALPNSGARARMISCIMTRCSRARLVAGKSLVLAGGGKPGLPMACPSAPTRRQMHEGADDRIFGPFAAVGLDGNAVQPISRGQCQPQPEPPGANKWRQGQG